MSTILLVIHILLAVALVGVILIQRNEGGLGGLGGGGGGGSMMSGRSAANLLTRSTAIIAALFMVNSIALAIVAGIERGSILDDGVGIESPVETNAATTTDTTEPDTTEPAADGGDSAPATTE